jgi:hypothetical protein
MKKIIQIAANFANWIYYTSYQQNVVKTGNPEIYVYSYISFIYTDLCLFLWNIISIFLKAKPLEPIWFVIIYIIILGIIFYYYDIKKAKYKIKIKMHKYDDNMLTIIFVISTILCFGSYSYLIK